MDLLPFNIVKGSEAAIKSCAPKPGYVWFALDTRKIYYSDGEDFISMGGNSSVFYGTLSWSEDDMPDTDQVEFDFTPADIEGDATPNVNDLILNSDGCFYRVLSVNDSFVHTLKLTIAGSGGGGGGTGPITTNIITISAPVSTKYFLDTETTPNFSFDVHSTMETGNKISKITYTIGTRSFIDDEPHDFGTITLDLKNYFNFISETGTNLSFVVEDIFGAKKTSSTYTLRKVKLFQTADTSNNADILQANQKLLQYRTIPVGSDAIRDVVITYKIYVEGSAAPIATIEKPVSNLTGSAISQTLDFAAIDTINNGLGAYRLTVQCTGKVGGQEVNSNILSHSVISYGENPILIAYMPSTELNQYEGVDLSYEIAKSIEDNKRARITFEVDGEQTVQEVEYNNIYKFNIYFETTGWHRVVVRDTFGHTQSFNDIYVKPYDGSMQVINNDDIDLMLNLTARGKSNNEIASSRQVWVDKKRNHIASLSNMVWGNVNGWLTDSEGANMLRLSSGATLQIDDYQPFGLNANNQEGMQTGKTIELDFRVSNVTDYTQPLITCLSYDTNNNILCGFHITGEAATFNTHNIKATGGTIIEGDSDQDQAYNTQIQGLTAKFAEGERIHLTWVIQKKTERYPMIKTYINGIVSGITEYVGGSDAKSDSIAQNTTAGALPALIKIDSTNGVVDFYNIRVFDKDLTDRQVLENYIATLPTSEQKTACYNSNIGLLDSNGQISINNIESGNYNMTVPYVKFTGGGQCRKDKVDGNYYLTNADGTNHLPRAKKDFRLVNHFDFVYPTDTKRNVDLTSEVAANGKVNGIIMYGQGTSSMEYPVKNLRVKFKMKNSAGKKVKFQVNSNDYPVDILTLKADYMESSSSHNTGTANLVFDSLEALGFHTPGQDYWNSQNPDYKTLTAIRGYPIICFFRPDENSDFEYIGRYNLNMDKSSEEAFGFLPVPETAEEIDETGSNIEFGWQINDGTKSNLDPAEHPYVNAIHCYEFLNNASNLDNFIVGDSGLNFHDLFYQEVNVDGELVPNWTTSFESRYPEDDTDVEAFYQMCAWLNSTNPDEATNQSLTESQYGYSVDSAEYRLAKFTNEFEDHFNKNFVLFYYVLTHVLLMIDSRAKNMMIATWDNQHWYPIFYDMDTMLGLNNYGYNKFDYNVEDKDANVFNGQASVLWNNLKTCFGADIRTMYNEMQQNGGLNYGNLLRNYNAVQADMWNEIMYNYDANYKYIKPYAEGYYDGKNLDENGDPVIIPAGTKNYLYAAQGSRSMHRKYWLKNRIAYFNGKYLSNDYRSDKFTMRLYTPEAGADNYYRVYNITEEQFNNNTYYTRSANPPYIFTKATTYDSSTDYYMKADNRLEQSLQVVPPNNNYTLTPLHNAYLAVAFGGDNGQTSGPHYAIANVPYLVAAPASAKYNDTETYVYGASEIKDLGDLSSQYLGLFSFPGETKLETLVLGNRTNGYYNPNFSALSIGNAAPQLKLLDISNTQLKSTVDLSNCQNIQKVFACGSSITSVSLPSYGVLEELRLPTTVTSLVMDNQTHLTIDKFTIGTYDSTTDTYSNATTMNLLNISIEGMPQFDSYALVKANAQFSLMRYCLRDVSWTVSAADIVDTVNEDGLKGIQALEWILQRNVEPQYKGSTTTTMRALTGTVKFANDVDSVDALHIYEHYASIFPDLVFEFDANAIKHINLYDGDNNLYWSKPIAKDSILTAAFYESSSYGAFTVPQKTSTQQYKYTFENKWLLNDTEVEGELPIVSEPVTEDLNFYPQFTETIQTYEIIYHINDEIITIEAEFGTPWIDAIPKRIPASANNTPLSDTNRSAYPFLGYSESGPTARDNLFDLSPSNTVTSAREFFAVFGAEKVDVGDHVHIFYPAWDISYSNNLNYIDTIDIYSASLIIENGDPSLNVSSGYRVQYKDGWNYAPFATIPGTTENGKPITRLTPPATKTGATSFGRLYCENNSQLRVIDNYCFNGTNISSLTYFDFPLSLRQIGVSAFQGARLTNTRFGNDNTIYIGPYAFNQGLGEINLVQIPSNVNILDNRAFSHSDSLANPWSLQIGDSSNEPSMLDLSKYNRGASNPGSRGIFAQNDIRNILNTITFYTNKYHDQNATVDEWNVTQHLFGDKVPQVDSWNII